MVDRFIQDVRFGLRSFVRQPVFSLTAILAVGLGIGANAAVFSVVNAVLLKPLPYPEPAELAYIYDTFPAVRNASVSFQKYQALRDGNRTFTVLGAGTPARVTLTGGGDPEEVVGYQVSATLFRALGVPPLHGRYFTEAEDTPNGPKAVVLSEGLWKRRFGADPRIVGSTITVNGTSRTVVGITPAASVYPARTEAWIPLGLSPETAQAGSNFLRLVGRTRPGVSIEQARQDLIALTAAYNKEHGIQRDTAVVSLQELGRTSRRAQLLILQGAVAFVLLIACANVANLLLARSVNRERELAVRVAMGASRRHVIRQLLTESMLLALAGGAIGVGLAGWLLRLFVALAPPTFPRLASLEIDGGVLAFTFGLAALTGLLFGLAPVLRGTTARPNEALREGARGGMSRRARASSRVLVVAEVALALVLAAGAGLMVKSLLRLQNERTGLDTHGLLSFEISLPDSKYDTTRATTFAERAMDEIRNTPGVRAAGAINMLPMVNFGFNGPFRIEGRPPAANDGRAPVVEFRMVTPEYFEACGIPLRGGRAFTDRDRANTTPVVIINETMARKFWPTSNPVGARLFLGVDTSNAAREIVGVVGDVRSSRLDTPPVPESYVPYAQVPYGTMGVVVRTTSSEPESVLPAIRRRIAALDPDLPLTRVRTMDEIVTASAGDTRLSSMLTSLFALLAAILASLGVYSVIAYSVAQRTRELGVRVALGADGRRLARLVVGEGLALAGMGIAIGVGAALLLTRYLASLLYEVTPTDPIVMAGTCAGVLMVALLAAYVPARRAMRVDPMAALRAE